MDWVGILRELRLLAIDLQTDRFYALYVLALLVLLVWIYRLYRSNRFADK